MALPLDDILKAIAKRGGPAAQIARTATVPTVRAAPKVAPATMGPTWGKLAGKGLLAGYTPPQVSQHERREGPGGLFGAALTAIDLGRGIMTSTIKESIDLMQGEGFDPGEWWNQATTQYGFGELIHDERNWVGGMMMATSPFTGGVGLALGAGVLADKIWADRIIGFIGDVAVDPLMYMGGFGAFARGAGWAAGVKQLNDIAKVRKLSPAAKAAVGRAKGAAGQKKSLSAAVRSLRKEGDVGRELIKDLGWEPGLRLRAPMTGPFGRQLRKVGGVGDRVWDAASRVRGKPSWVTARRVEQIPKMYDDMFDKRTLTEMVDAFGRGRKAMQPVMEAAERQLGPEMAAKMARVAAQAAKAPLEVALPGLRFGRAAGAAGLGGRFISQTADFPIRGTQKVTTEKFRTKVATLFDPQASLRVELASGNPKRVARAVGISDSQRFAAGRAKIAERSINSANQKVLNWIRRRGTSDTSMTALVRAIRGIDNRSGRAFAVRGDDLTGRRAGEIIAVDTSTNWFKNLPEDLQQLYRTDRERFVAMARAADQQLDEVQRHVFTAYGDNFGDDVLRREGARYSGHRQINREFLKAILGKQEKVPELRGRRGYPVRGRAEPSSVKERGYRTGGPLPVEEPGLLPPVVEGRTGVVQMVTDEGQSITVLADEAGNPFKFRNPNKVGMSFDAQVNRVTQQTFGMNLYDDRFSMLSHMQMRNLETDIRMYAFMRKLEADGTVAVAGPDEIALLDDIVAATAAWDELLEQQAGLGASRARLAERVAGHRSNETAAASHRANRDADVARLSDEGVAAYDELAEVDVMVGEVRANLLVMEEELGLLGARSAAVNDLQAKTRVLIERTDKVSRQKEIRGEMLSERDSIIAEVEGHIRQLDDLMKLLDELTRLRPELEAAIRADIGGVPGGVARLQSDLVAAQEATVRVEATYAAKKAEYDAAEQTYTTAVADFKRSVSEAGEARPQAARAEVKAQQLEAEAARTAIPDIGDDPWVVAARDELADAEVALQVVEREQQQLLQRIAAIEALPGFVEEGSKAYNAARLATARLYVSGEGGLSVKNPLVHTKNGAVRRGALRARQEMLTERVDRAVEELDEAITRGMDDALEADLERTIPNRPNTPEVRARTAEIKRLRGEIDDVRQEREWLETQLEKGPFPTAELTGRPGAAAANARAVKRAVEARKIERPTSKYTAARKELKDAEAALGAAKRRLRTRATNPTVQAAEDRVAAARRALAEVPPEEPTFRPEAVGRVDEPVAPAPGRTLRDAKKDLRDLRKELRGLLFADAADRRAQSVLQGRRWDGLRYKAADKKKIRAKREKVSKARKTLETEQGNAAKPLKKAQEVVEAHTRRDIAREAKDALEREVAVVKRSEAGITGRAVEGRRGVESGRLPVAQERRATAAQAVADQEARALRTGGRVEIVGATDPRVRNPRLFAAGPATEKYPTGRGLIRIDLDDEGNFALLRAERVQRAGAENAWKFTHLVEDLTGATLPPSRGMAPQPTREIFDATRSRFHTVGGELPSDPPRPYKEQLEGALNAIRRGKAAGEPVPRTKKGAEIMEAVGEMGSLGGGPRRAEMRRQGWRFFDEDVAEGSTRISGEAGEARQAAGATSRRAYEAERSAAEATKRMAPVGPKPEVPSTTYESSTALREAFEEQVANIQQQVGFVREQLKIVNASLYRFAENDVTTDAMVQIRKFLKALERGVAGAEGTTASARVNRYMDNLNELTRLMRSVDFERTLGVEKLPVLTRRLAMFNKRIAEIGAELGVDTRLENIVADLPGMQQRVPRLSVGQLQELRGQHEVLEDLQRRANVLLAEASQRGEDYAKAARWSREYGRREAKNQAQVAALEAGALVRQLEKETALFNDMRMAMRTRRELTKRISATTERLDREGTFVVSPKSDKDVRRLALEVEGARAKQGVEGRGAWTEPGAKDQRVVRERSLKEVLDIAHSIEPRGGYDPASVEGKMFWLNQKERNLAQEYLKASLSSNEWGPWTLSKGDAEFHDQMNAVIRAFAKVNDPAKWDGSQGLWKVWDNFQTYLKAAMIATPGFVHRNIFGAFFNAWLDDVNPLEIMRSAKMTLRVAKRAREDGVGFYSAAKQLAKTNPEYRQYVELLDVGVRGGGQAVHSVELEIGLRNAMDVSLLVGGKRRAPATSVSLAPWSPRFAWFQGVRSVNSWVEDIVRLGVGMDTMRWGGNVDDALRRIAKTQFDYDELTQFERTWMRRFFPFYTWTRKNVPYQLDQLGRNPAKFNKILAGKRNAELGTEEEDIVPDYFLEPFGVRTPFKYKGATVYSAPDFPFQDLARYDPFDRERGGLKEVGQNVASMLTPILKAPLETWFGKQLYNGVPFTGRFQLAPASISKFPGMSQALQGIGWIKQSPNGEWKMRDHHIYLITNMLPTLGFLRRIAPNEPKYQRAYLRTLMSTIGGVSASFNTDQAKNNWLTNLRYERQEERQEWKDMTSQTR